VAIAFKDGDKSVYFSNSHFFHPKITTKVALLKESGKFNKYYRNTSSEDV
jgi:hypothetical protein